MFINVYNLLYYQYFIGNFPLSDHLATINNKIRGFEKSSLDEGIKNVKPFGSSPKRISLYGPLDPSKKLVSIKIHYVFK